MKYRIWNTKSVFARLTTLHPSEIGEVMLIQKAEVYDSSLTIGLTTLMVLCENDSCNRQFFLSYDANTETTVSACCPYGPHSVEFFNCMNNDCKNLLPGDFAIMVRIGKCSGGGAFIDTDFSAFNGPQYACSTKCLVEAMSQAVNPFVSEEEYRSRFSRTDYVWTPRPTP